MLSEVKLVHYKVGGTVNGLKISFFTGVAMPLFKTALELKSDLGQITLMFSTLCFCPYFHCSAENMINLFNTDK